jgi:hypothetical protein
LRLDLRRGRESSARGNIAAPIIERDYPVKKILAFAALAALSACSKPAPSPEAETATASDAPVADATNIAADGQSSIGTFKITDKDGKIYVEEDKADGTYVGSQDGKVVETGKWVQKDPKTFCYTKDEKDPKEVCNTEKIENGVWISTNAKGDVSKVERVGG